MPEDQTTENFYKFATSETKLNTPRNFTEYVNEVQKLMEKWTGEQFDRDRIRLGLANIALSDIRSDERNALLKQHELTNVEYTIWFIINFDLVQIIWTEGAKAIADKGQFDDKFVRVVNRQTDLKLINECIRYFEHHEFDPKEMLLEQKRQQSNRASILTKILTTKRQSVDFDQVVNFDRPTVSDGMQKANGDSEFLGRVFNGCSHSKLGQEVEILSTVSKERRHNRVSLESDDGSVSEYGVKQKRPELSGYAKVVYSEPLQYFDRDMFLKFCDLGWKNLSDDKTTCIVSMPKLCKDMFGSSRPQESEEMLIIDSLRRLAKTELVDFNVQVVKSKSTSNSEGDVTEITRQPFLSFSEGVYRFKATRKKVKCFLYPASSKFILYEYAKELGRIRSFTPDLIPPAMPRTESSYNLYCILRDRMSWFDPKNPYLFKFEDFFDPSEVRLSPRVDVSGLSAQEIETKLQTAIRNKRKDRIKEIKKLLDYWSQKGVCRYELIKEKRPGHKDPVDVGWKFTEVNREMMIGKIPFPVEKTKRSKRSSKNTKNDEEKSSPKETE